MLAVRVPRKFASNVLALKNGDIFNVNLQCLQPECSLRGTRVGTWEGRRDTHAAGQSFGANSDNQYCSRCHRQLVATCSSQLVNDFIDLAGERSFRVSPMLSTLAAVQRQDLINWKKQKYYISQWMSLCFANWKMQRKK